MIVIAGYQLVNSANRDKYVDAFTDLVTRARAFDGCIDIAITADSVDPERINTLEVWQDEDAWKRWRKQAKGPRTGKPHHVDVRRYDAADGVRL
jgi:heme-degrading monooxygenase HmoA